MGVRDGAESQDSCLTFLEFDLPSYRTGEAQERQLHRTKAARIVVVDQMVTFYDFPAKHWRHLRTTSVVESPFTAPRLRTDAAKRFKRVDSAIAVIWKMLMVAESRFRKMKAPELMKDIHLGAVYKDGIVIEPTQEMAAA